MIPTRVNYRRPQTCSSLIDPSGSNTSQITKKNSQVVIVGNSLLRSTETHICCPGHSSQAVCCPWCLNPFSLSMFTLLWCPSVCQEAFYGFWEEPEGLEGPEGLSNRSKHWARERKTCAWWRWNSSLRRKSTYMEIIIEQRKKWNNGKGWCEPREFLPLSSMPMHINACDQTVNWAGGWQDAETQA